MGFSRGEEVLFIENGTPGVVQYSREGGPTVCIYCMEFNDRVKTQVSIEFHADNLPLFIERLQALLPERVTA